jgi:dihydrofolate reductase
MKVNAIVAVAKNNVIGLDDKLPWYLPADLKYFKRMTLDHHIIMGRKTFMSLNKPLPRRTNIILTRDPFFIAEGALVAHSIYEALEIAFENEEQEAFIIGGGEIYKQSLPYLDKIYLTEVDIEIDGDTYFPELSASEWKLIEQEPHKADERNAYDYVFKTYEKINPKSD